MRFHTHDIRAAIGRFICTRYQTDCYHCKKNADPVIRAVPNQAQVPCGICGRLGWFVILSEDIDINGILTKIGKYPDWELLVEATCRNCKVTGPMISLSDHVVLRCHEKEKLFTVAGTPRRVGICKKGKHIFNGLVKAGIFD